MPSTRRPPGFSTRHSSSSIDGTIGTCSITSRQTTASNTGGSTAHALVNAALETLRAEQTVELSPGAETMVRLPAIPAHWPTGSRKLVASAWDRSQGVGGRLDTSVQIAGTSATLNVSTDREIYASSSAIRLGARATNGAVPLSGALLHLEIRTACLSEADEESFHHNVPSFMRCGMTK